MITKPKATIPVRINLEGVPDEYMPSSREAVVYLVVDDEGKIRVPTAMLREFGNYNNSGHYKDKDKKKYKPDGPRWIRAVHTVSALDARRITDQHYNHGYRGAHGCRGQYKFWKEFWRRLLEEKFPKLLDYNLERLQRGLDAFYDGNQWVIDPSHILNATHTQAPQKNFNNEDEPSGIDASAEGADGVDSAGGGGGTGADDEMGPEKRLRSLAEKHPELRDAVGKVLTNMAKSHARAKPGTFREAQTAEHDAPRNQQGQTTLKALQQFMDGATGSELSGVEMSAFGDLTDRPVPTPGETRISVRTAARMHADIADTARSIVYDARRRTTTVEDAVTRAVEALWDLLAAAGV